MLHTFSVWMHSTSIGWAVRGGVPWLWPACETLHFIGMALLIGIVGLIDIRMLGVAKGLSLEALQRLLPWGIVGFAINLLTGLAFFAGDPFQYTNNWVFWVKLAFIVIAGVNAGLFYVTGLSRRVDALGADADVPAGAKAIAAVSLFLWFGVMYLGRMLPFLGGAF